MRNTPGVFSHSHRTIYTVIFILFLFIVLRAYDGSRTLYIDEARMSLIHPQQHAIVRLRCKPLSIWCFNLFILVPHYITSTPHHVKPVTDVRLLRQRNKKWRKSRSASGRPQHTRNGKYTHFLLTFRLKWKREIVELPFIVACLLKISYSPPCIGARIWVLNEKDGKNLRVDQGN